MPGTDRLRMFPRPARTSRTLRSALSTAEGAQRSSRICPKVMGPNRDSQPARPPGTALTASPVAEFHPRHAPQATCRGPRAVSSEKVPGAAGGATRGNRVTSLCAPRYGSGPVDTTARGQAWPPPHEGPSQPTATAQGPRPPPRLLAAPGPRPCVLDRLAPGDGTEPRAGGSGEASSLVPPRASLAVGQRVSQERPRPATLRLPGLCVPAPSGRCQTGRLPPHAFVASVRRLDARARWWQ